MKTLFAIAIVGIAANANAETLSFPAFRIEVEDGWAHNVEEEAEANNEFEQLIRIYHPNGKGTLKIQSYCAPEVVSRQVLRNMTNVDSSTKLDWQNWGGYSGFLYEYTERASIYRQWWLANERTLVFIVYDSIAESSEIEIEEINKVVNSIAVNRS